MDIHCAVLGKDELRADGFQVSKYFSFGYSLRKLGLRETRGGSPIEINQLLESVDEMGIREHLIRSLPIMDLLDWLHTHYSHLKDATLLRIFHDLQHESDWMIEPNSHIVRTQLTDIAIVHYPHHVNKLP